MNANLVDAGREEASMGALSDHQILSGLVAPRQALPIPSSPPWRPLSHC